MFVRLVLLFTLVPLTELWVLTQLGRRVGIVPTVLLVLATGALGAWLARSQGTAAWRTVQTELAAGRLPATAMIDGLLILLAGAVLLTPGLLTDVAGFFLLIPEGRTMLREALARRWRERVRVQTAAFGGAGPRRGPVIVTDDYRERREPVATLHPLDDSEPPPSDRP